MGPDQSASDLRNCALHDISRDVLQTALRNRSRLLGYWSPRVRVASRIFPFRLVHEGRDQIPRDSQPGNSDNQVAPDPLGCPRRCSTGPVCVFGGRPKTPTRKFDIGWNRKHRKTPVFQWDTLGPIPKPRIPEALVARFETDEAIQRKKAAKAAQAAALAAAADNPVDGAPGVQGMPPANYNQDMNEEHQQRPPVANYSSNNNNSIPLNNPNIVVKNDPHHGYRPTAISHQSGGDIG